VVLVGAISFVLLFLGLLVARSDGRVIRGTSRGDVLRGTNRSDVIEGRGGNDRLFGRGGNDRLIGGAGKDRVSCGSGRDTVVVGISDVLRGCEVMQDSAGARVSVGRPSAGGGPPPAGCRNRTRPVLVREHGAYIVRRRVVVDCRQPVPAPPPVSAPAPPVAPPAPPAPPPPPDWVALLTRGAWVEPVATSMNLWFFTNDGTAGLRRGSRNFCPNGNCGLSPYPAAFVWQVQGTALIVEFYGGITTTRYEIVGYDAAADALSLTYGGTPTVFYGCASPSFPAGLRGPGTCPQR
jgi:hypothetical protein